jgi:hypothetical protein
MQMALRSGSADERSAADRSPRTSRINKFLAAGVATVGAGAMAINPVVPTPPALHEAQVALTAAANPLAAWQQTIAETMTNLRYLAINAQSSSEALGQAVTEADLFGDITNLLVANASNPVPLLAALANLQATYGDTIRDAWFAMDDPETQANESGAVARLQAAFQQLVASVLPDMLNYDTPTVPPGTAPNPRTDEVGGPFTQPLFEFNYWFVENFIGAFRTVTPINDIPGELIKNLPGGENSNLPALLAAVSESGIAKASFAPVTAAFQAAAIFDAAYEALANDDPETAVRELILLPAKVTNAFINGYQPSFSPDGEWPGLIDGATPAGGRLSAPGLIEYALVTFPNELTSALGGTPPVLETPETTDSASKSKSKPQQEVSSPAVAPSEQTVNLDLDGSTPPKKKAKGADASRQTNLVNRVADRIQDRITGGLDTVRSASTGRHAVDNGAAAKDRVTVRDLVSRLGVGNKQKPTSTDTHNGADQSNKPNKSEASDTD